MFESPGWPFPWLHISLCRCSGCLIPFFCVAGSLTGPRPQHYADLDRDGHVVRGSFRGYHRGRGRVMHGKLLAHNSDVFSGCEKHEQPVTCLLSGTYRLKVGSSPASFLGGPDFRPQHGDELSW